jgi:2-C-methyl-D-erythritol 4-phosphate cytidylyltransferase
MLTLGGRELIVSVVNKAKRVASEIVIACRADEFREITRLCPGCKIVEGGASRQESIERLVAASTRPWIILHDVARPFASENLCRAVLERARVNGVAGALAAGDTPLGRCANGLLFESLPRVEWFHIQSPQAFRRELLVNVLECSAANGWKTQSILELALLAGIEVSAVPGERTNIKLTQPEDLLLAQGLSHLLE